ncbi:TcpQ domain-containing protein [Castellaniella sp.]|uniref:TcpQ domain-containing protein n=1 Tax=Castellaniella sp. TaxID=1955812 RepID=UPI002AFF3879|nr:TcpQ domain-containing protein [Castellaniella sp.]
MRKPYILLTALVAITPAHAALVIEPEPAPAYIPYTPVAPQPAPPSAAVPMAAPGQGTAPQQFQPQPVAQPSAPAAAVQAPAQAAPESAPSANDQAKKLLAEDVSKVLQQAPVAADKPTDKQLGGQINSAKIATEGKLYKLNSKDEASTAAPAAQDAKPGTDKAASKDAVAEVSTEEQAPEIKSDVVEVKPTVAAEPLPSWDAVSGTTLRKTIEGWSSKEGWDVRWESELLDYPIEEPFSLVGKYLDVITRTFELYKDAKRPFKVEIYPSQKLVVVKEKK